jgi:Ferritin-like
MIKLQRSIIHGIREAKDRSGLYYYLQKAVELEHSTVPPYLTALFSLIPGYNEEIRKLIHSIVLQEMLHLTINSNILIAIGGHPQINSPGFIPQYPGPLPMSIGGEKFVVGIEAFSKPLVLNTFMVIEEPECPIPVKTPALVAQEPEFATIGEFYDAVKMKIIELGDSIFTVEPDKQVLNWFSPDRLFPIVDCASAVRGIDIIVVEGEGTSSNPFQMPGDPAHYYKFGEIYYGRKIVCTSAGYAYDGDPVPFDANGVYPMKPNPKLSDFKPGSQAYTRLAEFSFAYSNLLNALHTAFNGEPDHINVAIGLMYELKMLAVALMQTPANDGTNMTAGPSYVYVDAKPT